MTAHIPYAAEHATALHSRTDVQLLTESHTLSPVSGDMLAVLTTDKISDKRVARWHRLRRAARLNLEARS